MSAAATQMGAVINHVVSLELRMTSVPMKINHQRWHATFGNLIPVSCPLNVPIFGTAAWPALFRDRASEVRHISLGPIAFAPSLTHAWMAKEKSNPIPSSGPTAEKATPIKSAASIASTVFRTLGCPCAAA